MSDTSSIATLKLSGVLTGEKTVHLTTQLRALFADHKHLVLLDVADLTEIEHAGYHALYRAARYLMWHNGKIVLLNPNERVQAILAKTGLGTVLVSTDNKQEAIKMLLVET